MLPPSADRAGLSQKQRLRKTFISGLSCSTVREQPLKSRALEHPYPTTQYGQVMNAVDNPIAITRTGIVNKIKKEKEEEGRKDNAYS